MNSPRTVEGLSAAGSNMSCWQQHSALRRIAQSTLKQVQLSRICALGFAGSIGMAASGASADWQLISTSMGNEDAAETVILTHTTIKQVALDIKEFQGRWIKVSGHVADASVYTKFTMQAFKDGNLTSSSLNTSCSERKGPAYCESAGWVPYDASSATLTVYSENTPAVISALRVYRSADNLPIQPQARVRMSGLFEKMQGRYYRTEEVNWDDLRVHAIAAMAAPADFDPVPGTVTYVKNNLPGSKHTFLLSKLKRAPEVEATSKEKWDAGVLPSCSAVGQRTWKLVLPTTFNFAQNLKRAYVQKANQCLLSQPSRTNWVLDLRGNGGGHSGLTISAIAPLFKTGLLFTWVNGQKEEVQVLLSSDSVKMRDKHGSHQVSARASHVGVRAKAQVIAWIGPGCASACEAAVVALLGRPKTRLVGQSSAGYATGNETIFVNKEYDLALTAGRMKDKSGRLIGDSVEPQISNDSNDIAEILLLSEMEHEH
jgi:hypothetical protein